ncbi:unnamed protein product [Didymodactylos carnosus]|uniref:Uncharacterized protein n=1 Tax=Didymodactylos carnosus TaxID=1234261 RepID=A0A813QZ48_9BILA|nr:unnamed protein product [Didymodactylos carnosus]CAF3557707.1 unnamed protein product [Didymodactylos carnosus]
MLTSFHFVYFVHLTLLWILCSISTIYPNESVSRSDCKHLILPIKCQCYHSDHASQLRCRNSKLHSLIKLPINMRWNALDFSQNYITSVDSYIFSDIYVEKIDLSNNYIGRIEQTAFESIKNLKELYLKHNQMKGFDPLSLKSTGKYMEKFDISNNPFEQQLDVGEILVQLPELKIFYARWNNINNTSLYTLLKLQTKREIITLSHEDNKNMTTQIFGHYNLELFDLSHNNITTLCNGLFDGLYNLKHLILDYNHIDLIDNNLLKNLKYLEILSLTNNYIRLIPAFYSQTLITLNFSSNLIERVSDYFAANLHSITYIDFDDNYLLNITTPRAFCYINLFTLQRLSFRNNNLITLNSFGELLCRLNTTDSTRHNKYILDVNNNINLKCNCILIQFQQYLFNYQDLSCTQYGQDRYFVSALESTNKNNCTLNFCDKYSNQTLCVWPTAHNIQMKGTCEKKSQKFNSTSKLKFNQTHLYFENTTMINISLLLVTNSNNISFTIDNRSMDSNESLTTTITTLIIGQQILNTKSLISQSHRVTLHYLILIVNFILDLLFNFILDLNL